MKSFKPRQEATPPDDDGPEDQPARPQTGSEPSRDQFQTGLPASA